MSHSGYKHIGTPTTRLIEECAELTMALCKVERFGWFNYHPDRPSRTNMDDVKTEMADVVEAIERVEKLMREILNTHDQEDAP